ncbi:hypothetical protein DV737_g2312, partial [Chaetothyriales sp. CBS 132003]
MVTLLGFLCIIVNIVILLIYIPDLVGPGPTWVYYSFALGLWLYSTMDNIDGKQARRTGTSSPLGELFDHGIDSLNCTLGSLLETAAMALGPTPIGTFTAMVPCLPMFFSTWETYHTHTLYLGVFNGPTEGLIIASFVMAISGYFGPQIWAQPFSSFFPSVSFPFGLGSYSMRQVWVPIILTSFLFVHLPFCIYHVVQARQAKNLPVAPVFLEWFPVLVFCGSCIAWLGSPYSTLLSDNHLVLWCLTQSFVFGRLTTKIILHHLARQAFPYWTVMLVPLVGGAALVNLPYLGLPRVFSSATEVWYLRAYFLFALVAYSTWAMVVINKICAFLDINCLTIKKKTKVEKMVDKQLEIDGFHNFKRDVEQMVQANGNGELEKSARKRSPRKRM